MIPKVSSYIPQPLLSFELPENKAVRLALFILGGFILLLVGRSLVGRVSSYLRNKIAEVLLNSGHNWIDNKQMAEQFFKGALSWAPSNPDLRAKIFLGLTKVVQDKAEAYRYFQAVFDARPQNESTLLLAYIQRAQKYFYDKKYVEALTDLEFALPLAKKKKKLASFPFPSQVECERGNHAKAIEFCKKVMNGCLTPKGCQTILLHLAKRCFSKKREGPRFNKDIMPPTCFLPYLAKRCFDKKNREAAFLYLKEALALNPAKDFMRAKLLFYRAFFCFDGQQFSEGLENLEEALKCEMRPDLRGRLLLNRRHIYLHLGHVELAKKDLEQASKDFEQASSKAVEPILKKEIQALTSSKVDEAD